MDEIYEEFLSCEDVNEALNELQAIEEEEKEAEKELSAVTSYEKISL